MAEPRIRRTEETTTTTSERAGPIIGAGILLGIGLGGFVDGILFHQILQWHAMMTAWVPNTDMAAMSYNMRWDGAFHALTWACTAVGIGLLFHAGRRADALWSGRVLVGAMLGGWGLFNFVEGLIDHHMIGIHHVRPGEDQLAWDLGFLASGLVLMLVGAAIAGTRRGLRERHRYVGRAAFVGAGSDPDAT